MIQDIAPYQLKNEFEMYQPQAEDMILLVQDGSIYLKEEKGEISYPFYGQFTEGERQQCHFQYLFALEKTVETEKIVEIDKTTNIKPESIRFFLCTQVMGEQEKKRECPVLEPDVAVSSCEGESRSEMKAISLEGFAYRPIHFLRPAAPKYLAFAGLVGMQLSGWYQDHQFCGHCGSKMKHGKFERAMRCPACGKIEYPKICPCVIVGVLWEDKILVTKYKGRDTGHYALVAGFAEVGETIEETVHREVLEETGVHVKNLRYYKCQPWPFSESLLFGFFCELDGTPNITMEEDELSVATWISREDLQEKNMDFALTNEMLCLFKADQIDKTSR